MAIGEHLQPGYGPIGLASSNGYPWVRLATGVFAVAISLGMSWRADRMPVELARTQVPQPQQEQAAAPDLDRQEPEIVAAAAPADTLSPPVAPTLVARAPPSRPPAPPKRHQLQRTTTTQAKMRAHVVAHRNAGGNPLSRPIAHAKLIRTRSDLRREYLQAREQVAALTSEDSGSAYLTRLAARHNAAPTNLAGHAHGRSAEGRRGPARS